MAVIIQRLILTGIEAFCCNIFFHTFMKKRYKKAAYLDGVVLVFFTLSFFLISMMKQENYLTKTVCTILAIIIFMFPLYKVNAGQVIFCAICYDGILMAVDNGMYQIASYLEGNNPENLLRSSYSITVMAILCKSVLFLVVVLISWKFSGEDAYYLLEDKEWIRFLFFPIFTITAVLLFLLRQQKEEAVVLVISFGLLASNFILFYLIRDFVRREKENQELFIIRERVKNQMAMYESMKLSFQEQRIRAHEFKNHMDCIQGLLRENEITKAMEYVNNINENVENNMNYFNTSNPVINAVINQKFRQAKELDIAVIIALDQLDEVNIQEEDLVVLLANLLNNAIEACEKLDKEKRFIKFKFVREDKKYIISIKNPVRETIMMEHDQIRTSKDNPLEHGVGLLNIKNIIGKYHGEGVCTCHDGYFCYTLIFWINE